MPSLRVFLLTFNCARSFVDPEILAKDILDALPANTTLQSARALPDVIAISLQEVAPITPGFLGGPHLEPYLQRVGAAIHLLAEEYARLPDWQRYDNSTHEETFTNVLSRNAGMTALMVFAKQQVADTIRWVTCGGVGVGVGEMGNKGAVGIRLGFDTEKLSSSLQDPHVASEQRRKQRRLDEQSPVSILEATFVAAHLAPNGERVERRNRDWENIVRNLAFVPDPFVGRADGAAPPDENEPANGDDASQPLLRREQDLDAVHPVAGLYEKSDATGSSASIHFAFGDLNYRTSEQPPGKDAHLSYPQPTDDISSPLHFSHLLKKDQLNAERSAKRTFQHFDEVDIEFPPTYKYNSDLHWPGYDKGVRTPSHNTTWFWAAKRWPSWCDRILYLSQVALKLEKYTALPVQPASDHRPVALSAEVDLVAPLVQAEMVESPFPLSPDWESKRQYARLRELVVGSASWFVLTTDGRIALSGLVVGTIAAWIGILALLRSKGL